MSLEYIAPYIYILSFFQWQKIIVVRGIQNTCPLHPMNSGLEME